MARTLISVSRLPVFIMLVINPPAADTTGSLMNPQPDNRLLEREFRNISSPRSEFGERELNLDQIVTSPLYSRRKPSLVITAILQRVCNSIEKQFDDVLLQFQYPQRESGLIEIMAESHLPVVWQSSVHPRQVSRRVH